MIRKTLAMLGTAAIVGAAVALAAPLSASAHSGALTGSAACEADGSATITWTLANDYGSTMTVTKTSDASIPVGARTAAKATSTYTEHVEANAGGKSVTATLNAKWPDGFTQQGIVGTVTVAADCTAPIPVAIAPVTQTPPTCTEPLTYTIPELPAGLKYTLNPDGTRPTAGTYTLAEGAVTIQEHSIYGYVPVEQTFTIVGAPATGYQSTDKAGPCYQAPPIPEQPADLVTVKTVTLPVVCDTTNGVGSVGVETTTTTTRYVYDEDTNTWTPGIPVSITTTDTRRATADECAIVVPPTSTPTATPTPTSTPTPSVTPQPTASATVAPVATHATPTPAARAPQAEGLAYTGGPNMTPWAIGAVLAILLVVGARLYRRRVSKR